MPNTKPLSLSGMVDTDMDEDTLNADAFPTPDSNQENAGATKRRGPKPKGNARKFTKSKRLSGSSGVSKITTAPKGRARNVRAPLKEQANIHHAEETEEVDEFAAQTEGETVIEGMIEPISPAKRSAPLEKVGRRVKAQPTKQSNAVEKDGDFEYTPITVRQMKFAGGAVAEKGKGKGKGKALKQVSTEPQLELEGPETQPQMDIDISAVQDDDDQQRTFLPQPSFRRNNNARIALRQRQPPVARRRADSASSTERTAGDPTLRRKLGDMTRKFESIDLRYRNLREIGLKEAEANYDKLKALTEAKDKAANDLIASLRKEIHTQKAIAQESQSFQKQIQARDTDVAKIQALADQLSTSLAETQNENRALQARLANSRIAPIIVESAGSKTPGSAMKGRNQAQARTIMVGSAEAAHAAQVAQLKEDLYSDLTGLILRGVDIGSDSDTYDCIQTGRNGTLHFKLAIAKESEDSYEDTEFQYTPRLDSNRDRSLIALLPDYLTDEIAFPRTNAAVFYGKVLETLTKRRHAEIDE